MFKRFMKSYKRFAAAVKAQRQLETIEARRQEARRAIREGCC